MGDNSAKRIWNQFEEDFACLTQELMVNSAFTVGMMLNIFKHLFI